MHTLAPRHLKLSPAEIRERLSKAGRGRSGLETELLDAGFLESPLSAAEARLAGPDKSGRRPGRAERTADARSQSCAVVASAEAPPRISDEITHVLGALAPSLAARTCVAIHVTAATPGAGVSTVARELASTASTLADSRTLLLRTSAEASGLGFPAGTRLPDVVASRQLHGKPSVVAVRTSSGCFHAASCLSGGAMSDTAETRPRAVAGVCAVLQRSYDLIIVDCQPLTGLAAFLPVVPDRPKVLLVVAAGRTRNADAVRARNLIELRGGVLIGAVLYGGRDDA